ncbi:hypothetical protein B0F90DRAFT_1751074 [Multifurca ochricompacta]|uniref:DUF7330 domain-containing protein n=1 Tax=Multifurca ochricompacta TaxID=376703 RepID=A0AAD4LZ53_9AGAM|nr:hypothetical protein B0F90DRAFT_1751074 [Multifurca ochricompacta]
MVTLSDNSEFSASAYSFERDTSNTTDKGDDDKASYPSTNYLRVSKNGVAIEGRYLLDLSLALTQRTESESESESGNDSPDVKNLSLYTTSGAITAEIWIVQGKDENQKRARIELRSDNGSVRAKVHNPSNLSRDDESEPRPSLDIDLRANYGDISLSLPRCFRGPVTIHTTHERVMFSPALEECTAQLSDVHGVRVYFVGDRPNTGKWRSGEEENYATDSPEEPLDELSINGRHTNVRIIWDGESELPEMKLNGWENFCYGAERFFTTGRVV